jgi:hypothetical protein
MWRHHTRIEALSPLRAIAERAIMGLCGLEIILYPQTVLVKRGAERAAFASESQVRGRGRQRTPSTTIVV